MATGLRPWTVASSRCWPQKERTSSDGFKIQERVPAKACGAVPGYLPDESVPKFGSTVFGRNCTAAEACSIAFVPRVLL
eukprot:1617674-Rhodomonas_salina.1